MSVCDPFALESRDLSFSTWHIIRSRRKTSKPELPLHYFKSLMVWHFESFYGFRSKITFKGPFFNFLFLGLFLAAAIVSRFVVSPCWAELVVSTIAISPAIWSSGRKQVQEYDRNNQAIQHWRFFSVIYIHITARVFLSADILFWTSKGIECPIYARPRGKLMPTDFFQQTRGCFTARLLCRCDVVWLCHTTRSNTQHVTG